MSVFFNPHRDDQHFTQPGQAPLRFHRSMPGYAPGALVPLPQAAKATGAAALYAKVDHPRFGLPAFKILGASWAVARAVERRVGEPIALWPDLVSAAARLTRSGAFELTAATDGNHGRAVARLASWLGMGARIFVPQSISAARRAAIEGEGARVVVVPGSYDDAVHEAERAQSPRCMLISDVGIGSDDPVPGWVVEGYATSFWEVEEAFPDGFRPDVVVVQVGVGALAGAVVRHFRRIDAAPGTLIIGAEPVLAACALRSVRAGAPTTLSHTARSIMAGLNCEAPTLAAWPELFHGIDAYATVEDDAARGAMRLFVREGVEAGESGAAGLAGWMAFRAEHSQPPDPRVLVIVTEGATDPEAWAQVTGRTAPL